MERVADGAWRELPAAAPGTTGRIWTPAGAGDRAMLVHDGPEYERRAHLVRWAAEAIGAGAVPPFRLVLLEAADRNEAYSASAAYARNLAGKLAPALGLSAPVIGAGASLGALAMLHAQRRDPELFAGLFLQSGSFFQHRFDKQESGFARYRRILRFVSQVRRAPHGPAVPAAITCGIDEENLANNRSMAKALGEQGYEVTFAEVPGGHDWNSWRNAFDPHLTALLRRIWS